MTTLSLRKLFYRSVKRGTKENELLLRAFAEQYLEVLNPVELQDFSSLLDCLDPDLTRWLSDPTTLPVAHNTRVFWLLKALMDKGIFQTI
jgi:succinate dehydrogenase flavin-adding protein (antitoxin of CptAB toxin-antitoxin module)